VDMNTNGPPQEWVNAIAGVYRRNLIAVGRIGPPWGNRNIRSMADDANVTSFTQLADKYRSVVNGLPLRQGWPIYIEIHNEPNLCYEWTCNSNVGWMDYHQTAAEYARFLRDVADAIHNIGDNRIAVLNGGMAPGGAQSCHCGTDEFTGGVLGTDFLTAMHDAVPDIWDHIDGLASHSYPATNAGYGFWRPYDQCMAGLLYFQQELNTIGHDLPVFMTETGWPTDHDACPNSHCGSRQDVADWTVAAYNNPWLTDSSIQAVMPFMLQDPNWNNFAWVDGSNNPYPVYGAVRQLRCSLGIPPACN